MHEYNHNNLTVSHTFYIVIIMLNVITLFHVLQDSDYKYIDIEQLSK